MIEALLFMHVVLFVYNCATLRQIKLFDKFGVLILFLVPPINFVVSALLTKKAIDDR